MLAWIKTQTILILFVAILTLASLHLIYYKTKEILKRMGKIADLLEQANDLLANIDEATTREGEEVKVLANDLQEALAKLKAMGSDEFFQEKEQFVTGLESIISDLKSKSVSIQNIYTAPAVEETVTESKPELPEVKTEELPVDAAEEVKAEELVPEVKG